MTKRIALAAVLFFSVASLALGSGSGPIIIWPSKVVETQIHAQDVVGVWAAYHRKTRWFVEIKEGQRGGALSLEILSSGLKGNRAFGQLLLNGNTLQGAVLMADQQIKGVLLFRDEDGLKLRVTEDRKTYFDLLLYRYQ